MATMDQRYFEHAFQAASSDRHALITVRLTHSIPFSAREKLMDYRLRRDVDGAKDRDAQRMAELFAYWDLTLDLSPGPRWLEHPGAAESARRALRDMDGILCSVRSWVLLPTHIHVLAGSIIHSDPQSGMLHVAEALKVPVAGTTTRFFAGVGVVADSDPGAELAETRTKFRAMLGALIRP